MKSLLIKTILTGLFLSFNLISNAFSTDPPVRTLGKIVNQGGGVEIPYQIEDCTPTISLRVLIANLDLHLPFADQNGIESLPNGYPEMYLRYSIDNNPEAIVQLTDFAYDIDVNGTSIFQSTIESYPFDLTNSCPAVMTDDWLSVNYSLELVTPIISTQTGELVYIPYPACNLAGMDDIFSCEVFEDASHPDCPENESNCNDLTLTSTTGTLTIDCRRCASSQPPPSIVQEDQSPAESSLSKITAYPNPFDHDLTVEWPSDLELEKLQLFDFSGNLIQEWDERAILAEQKLNYNSVLLPKGLYFFKAQSLNDQKIIRIVKQ